MKKRLIAYIAQVNQMLELLRQEEDRDAREDRKKQVMEDILVQIGFFQHERIVHLIVTVTFALLTLLALSGALLAPQAAMFLLTALFLVLLIPYIGHYYTLENGVQELYRLYDAVRDC